MVGTGAAASTDAIWTLVDCPRYLCFTIAYNWPEDKVLIPVTSTSIRASLSLKMPTIVTFAVEVGLEALGGGDGGGPLGLSLIHI